MSSNNASLFPLLGTGAFFAMFLVGFVVGFELGLSCLPMMLIGFVFGGLGATFVAKLEHYDTRPPSDATLDASSEKRREAPAFVRERLDSASRG